MHRWARISQWGKRLLEFAFYQSLVQLLTGIAGLILVRQLPKSEYALFAIANGMQTSCNLLADFGISIGLRSIGGRVWNDPVRLGQLVTTALKLRTYFSVAALSICLPSAFWLLLQNGADVLSASALCIVIALAVVPLLPTSAWLATVQLHGDYQCLQRTDFAGAVIRVTLVILLGISRINAVLATAVGAVVNWFQMHSLRRRALELVKLNQGEHPEDRREIIKLSWKWMPNVVFFCLQGQITVLILTWFGNPLGVADITALGRVATFFTVLSTTFVNVIAPRFTRCQDSSRLPKLYLLLVGGSFLILATISALAWLWPTPFLWLLGPKYGGLAFECGLVVSSSCLSQLGVVMWTLNSSRGWIHYQSIGFIPSILAAQVSAACLLDLNVFRDVLIFNILTAVAPIPIYLLDAWRSMVPVARLGPTVSN